MPLHQSYFPNYFSIPDILATQERVPCKFEVKVNRLGFIDPSSEGEDIQPGAAVELPYWLARALCTRNRHIVNVDIPRIYKEAYREILKADASVVDLRKLGLFFYEFGAYLSNFEHRDGAEISSVLVQTFKERFRQVMDWSQNIMGCDPSLIARLDFLERDLFRIGQKARSDLTAWLNQGTGQITAAEMVVSHKKRKLTEMESS